MSRWMQTGIGLSVATLAAGLCFCAGLYLMWSGDFSGISDWFQLVGIAVIRGCPIAGVLTFVPVMRLIRSRAAASRA